MLYWERFFFIVATVGCMAAFVFRTEARTNEEICQLIRENYFRTDQPDVQSFLKRCESEDIPLNSSRTRAIKAINRRLTQIRSSHLSVYEPSETLRIWENEGSDTGLRSRMIDGELVITGTLPESPARRAELKAGDVVVTINDESPSSEQDAQSTTGFFKIARGRQIFLVDLKLEDLREDLSPSIVTLVNPAAVQARAPVQPQVPVQAQAVALEQATAVLRLPSFLPQYFESETWLPLAARLLKYKNLIVDIRGNAGGSFPAMLRSLTPLFCETQTVGELWRSPRGEAKELDSIDLPNDLDAQTQLKLFESSDTIRLKTFETSMDAEPLSQSTSTAPTPAPSRCFRGPVVVLIDSGTSSVSEIFAKAVQSRPDTKVWGTITAGQVVMARWFSIASLGGGDYSISIPIAGYRDQNGEDIERVGVRPTKELFYDLKTALRGEDSWINAAQESFKQ